MRKDKSPSKSKSESKSKSSAIPKELFAAATPPQPTNEGGVSHGHGGSSSNERVANGSSSQPTNNEGGVSHGHGGSSSSPEGDRSPLEQNKDMTVARMLGEIVWIMTQSPGHKHFALSDLEWMVMPALLLEQYRIFRNGDQPLGVALWAYLSPEAEEKLKSGAGRLRPDEWAVGMKLGVPEGGVSHGNGGNSSSRPSVSSAKAENQKTTSDGSSPHQNTYEVSKEEGGALWLVDLICPFHTPENKMVEQMLADLIQGPFKGKKFKFHHTDPATGERKVMELGG